MQQLLPQSIGEAGAQPLPLNVDLGLDQTAQQDQADQQPEAGGNGKALISCSCGVREPMPSSSVTARPRPAISSKLLRVLRPLSRARWRHPASRARALSSWTWRRRGSGCGPVAVKADDTGAGFTRHAGP